MDITLEDLQALTLLAQDPQRQDPTGVKAELSNDTARQVADVIMGRPASPNDPVVQKTAHAILEWVDRNRAAAHSNGRSESRERTKKARDWMEQHATAWQA